MLYFNQLLWPNQILFLVQKTSPVHPRLSSFISYFNIFYYPHSHDFYIYSITFIIYFTFICCFSYHLFIHYDILYFPFLLYIYILRMFTFIMYSFLFFILQALLYSKFYISFLLHFYQSSKVIYYPSFIFITNFAHLFFYFLFSAIRLF